MFNLFVDAIWVIYNVDNSLCTMADKGELSLVWILDSYVLKHLHVSAKMQLCNTNYVTFIRQTWLDYSPLQGIYNTMFLSRSALKYGGTFNTQVANPALESVSPLVVGTIQWNHYKPRCMLLKRTYCTWIYYIYVLEYNFPVKYILKSKCAFTNGMRTNVTMKIECNCRQQR